VNRPEVTSLAEELRMTGDDESCDNEGRGLLPAHDSCEVDSLPEDRGKEQGLLPPVQLQSI